MAKRPILGVHDSQGSAETLVRKGAIANYHLIAYSFSNISAKKLPKSVDVHGSYSVQRHCRFFETQCILGLCYVLCYPEGSGTKPQS